MIRDDLSLLPPAFLRRYRSRIDEMLLREDDRRPAQLVTLGLDYPLGPIPLTPPDITVPPELVDLVQVSLRCAPWFEAPFGNKRFVGYSVAAATQDDEKLVLAHVLNDLPKIEEAQAAMRELFAEPAPPRPAPADRVEAAMDAFSADLRKHWRDFPADDQASFRARTALALAAADAFPPLTECSLAEPSQLNWPNVTQEAKARLEQAQRDGQAFGERALFEYWCAWAAHENAVVSR